jgi:hypothetical protein
MGKLARLKYPEVLYMGVLGLLLHLQGTIKSLEMTLTMPIFSSTARGSRPKISLSDY